MLESTLNENTVKIEECEKGSLLLAENNKKLTAELENLLQVPVSLSVYNIILTLASFRL